MPQNPSAIIKLQSFCDNQTDDPQLFGLILHGFMADYDKNAYLEDINSKILSEAKSDTQSFEDLTEVTAYEMELAYYEYRNYQVKKYGSNYRPIFNDIFAFELYRDSKMAVISNPMIARYRILSDFVWFLADDNSDEARTILKKSAILDEEGRIQECIFASSFYEYENEKKRLENIQKTRVWYSWDRLAYFYLNYDQAQHKLKKEDIPELYVHMSRVLQYTITSCENKQSTNEEKKAYTIAYDHEKGLLKINGFSTTFKKNSDSRIVLKMLIPVNSSIKKRILEFETISETIMSNDHTKEDPDIYEICRSINKNIAKLGHPEFLFFKDDTVQINSNYLC
jgi:hypothetical protein